MTVPTNLFIDTPEAEDPSLTQVSSDSSEWSEEAITKIKERVPAAANFSLAVKFMAKDDEIGTATGSVTITDGEKAAVVPVIIRDFLMYPLDVFFFEGRVLPFTADYFAGVFNAKGQSAFSALTEYPVLNAFERYMRGESLQNVIFPPNWGRYSYASAESAGEKYPCLAEVSGAVDGAAFKKMAEQDAPSVIRYEEKHPGLLAKLANLRPVNMGEFRQGTDNLVMRTIHVLQKMGPNKYTILSNAKNTFNPLFTACDRTEARAFLSKVCDKVDDILNEVDQNGEKLVPIEDDLVGTPFLSTPDTGKIGPAEHFGLYTAKTKTGVNVTGLVIPTVIDFNQNPVQTKLFLGKTVSTMQPEIWGVEMTGKDRWMPEGCMPLVGQTGTFFLSDGAKTGLATIPVTIKSVMSEMTPGGTEMKIQAIDLEGRMLRLKISPCRLERIIAMPMTTGEVTYLIPNNMRWVAMDGFDELSSNPFAYAEKVAGEEATLINTGYGQYAIKGLDRYVEKLSWDRTMLGRPEVTFLLASAGASQEMISGALEKAASQKSVVIPGLKCPPLFEEKVASKLDRARELLDAADRIRCNLFKEASYIESAQTVDALLSLNFATPENIAKFVAKIPLFKAAISHLASCVIAGRIGIREIPEQAASSAIYKLIEVVNGLEALRAINASKGKG